MGFCAGCKKGGSLKKCPCKVVMYCSTTCQQEDWTKHKKVCSSSQKHNSDMEPGSQSVEGTDPGPIEPGATPDFYGEEGKEPAEPVRPRRKSKKKKKKKKSQAQPPKPQAQPPKPQEHPNFPAQPPNPQAAQLPNPEAPQPPNPQASPPANVVQPAGKSGREKLLPGFLLLFSVLCLWHLLVNGFGSDNLPTQEMVDSEFVLGHASVLVGLKSQLTETQLSLGESNVKLTQCLENYETLGETTASCQEDRQKLRQEIKPTPEAQWYYSCRSLAAWLYGQSRCKRIGFSGREGSSLNGEYNLEIRNDKPCYYNSDSDKYLYKFGGYWVIGDACNNDRVYASTETVTLLEPDHPDVRWDFVAERKKSEICENLMDAGWRLDEKAVATCKDEPYRLKYCFFLDMATGLKVTESLNLNYQIEWRKNPTTDEWFMNLVDILSHLHEDYTQRPHSIHFANGTLAQQVTPYLKALDISVDEGDDVMCGSLPCVAEFNSYMDEYDGDFQETIGGFHMRKYSQNVVKPRSMLVQPPIAAIGDMYDLLHERFLTSVMDAEVTLFKEIIAQKTFDTFLQYPLLVTVQIDSEHFKDSYLAITSSHHETGLYRAYKPADTEPFQLAFHKFETYEDYECFLDGDLCANLNSVYMLPHERIPFADDDSVEKFDIDAIHVPHPVKLTVAEFKKHKNKPRFGDMGSARFSVMNFRWFALAMAALAKASDYGVTLTSTDNDVDYKSMVLDQHPDINGVDPAVLLTSLIKHDSNDIMMETFFQHSLNVHILISADAGSHYVSRSLLDQKIAANNRPLLDLIDNYGDFFDTLQSEKLFKELLNGESGDVFSD